MREEEGGNLGGEAWIEDDSWLEEPTEEHTAAPPQERRGWHRRPAGAWDRRRLGIAGLLGLALVGVATVIVVIALGDEGSGRVAERAPQAPPPAQTAGGPTQQALALPERGSIGPGDRGRSVRRLQSALNEIGYQAGEPDGIFGPRTLRALRRFQRDAGLRPDGIAGAETLQALNRTLRERS
jgi:Putative peptidoglycan binding domain